MMPVAISEMIIEKFNSIGVSSTMASDAWLDTQLNYGVRMTNLTTGTDENLFAFSEHQMKQFEANGIKVVETSFGTTLLYQKGGQWVPVVGSSMNTSGLNAAITAETGLSNIGSPITAKEALADPDFKQPYTAAAKTWRGGGSGWFDELMENITETKLSIDRNRWVRYAAKSLGQMTEDFKTTAASTVKNRTSDYEVGSEKRFGSKAEYEASGLVEGTEYVPSKKDNWTSSGDMEGKQMIVTSVEEIPIYNEDNEIIDYEYIVKGANLDTVTNGAKTVSQLQTALNSKAVKVASAAGTVGCAVVEALMSIYTVVSAYQQLQFLNLISGFLESVDKMKAGDGDASPIHEYSTNLTTRADTVHTNNDGTQEVVANKTAMESAGMAWLFSDVSINSNDTSVQNVNFETVMSNMSALTSNMEATALTFEACGYIKMADAAVDAVSTVLSFIPIGGQAIKFAQLSVKSIGKAILQAAVATALSMVIPIITQRVAQSIIEDAATEWLGEDLGNAIISGSSKYLGGNGSSGGQGPGSEAKVLAYLSEQQVVIAEEAEYQRSIRSPFDISSPYTFLGSLAYSVLPMAYSSSGIMSAFTDVASLMTSSLVSLSPTADAVGLNNEINSIGDCPLLESTGAVGDAYCNPIIITDVDTIATVPESVEQVVRSLGNNLDDKGNVVENSDLAKYITYCGQRTSQYGLNDATITESILGSGTGSNIIGMIPVLGDIQAISEEIAEKESNKWITGDACIVSDENPDWQEYQWYQRYAENQRLVENINPGYTSNVTAYLEKYYEENPVDDSFEGTLARFSGMSKEDVSDTLALIEYYQFLDEYEPESRYAFVTAEEKRVEIEFNNDNVLAYEAILPEMWYNIIYDRFREAKA